MRFIVPLFLLLFHSCNLIHSHTEGRGRVRVRVGLLNFKSFESSTYKLYWLHLTSDPFYWRIEKSTTVIEHNTISTLFTHTPFGQSTIALSVDSQHPKMPFKSTAKLSVLLCVLNQSAQTKSHAFIFYLCVFVCIGCFHFVRTITFDVRF